MAKAVTLGAASGLLEDADEEEEEMEALLGGPQAASSKPLAASASLGQQRRKTRRAEEEGNTFARVLAAWNEPVGIATVAPAWLKEGVVCTEEEEECLAQLRHLASVAYSQEEPTHELQLRRYFAAVRSPAEARELPEGKDPRWKELGFQAEDPRTDFRGGGLLALQNMCFLAEAYPERTVRMLREAAPASSSGNGVAEYLFSAACINISAILVLLLGLNVTPSMSPVRSMPCPVHSVARKNFARALVAGAAAASKTPQLAGDVESSAAGVPAAEAREVLAELFSNAVFKLHAEWRVVCVRKPNATLLDFGDALSGTAVALERFLGGLAVGKDVSSPSRLFAPLELIDPAHWYTQCQNQFARCCSGAQEVACRLCAAVAQLLTEFG
eukprot:CAMPEP_0115274998 /NCGR_PEP_ID=MMETSP0270-20121206/55967_1 /TAXON_ID=71861 /ORGANISM="Scrippsiella trochoidea, Strain CCMP3099" /LENGTH=385 /DNA_ID=CAMNT_0002691533 /DNA_START=1 /DNA_END=1155 /DNA_ORIENTATION=+